MSANEKRALKRLKKHLKTLLRDQPNSISVIVTREALESDSPITFLEDVLRHGCVSGIVSSLIYYRDTHAFFDTHYEEIETLRHDYEHEMGHPIQPKGDLKNDLAWFAYEYVAYQIYLRVT